MIGGIVEIIIGLWLLKLVWFRPRQDKQERDLRISLVIGIAHTAFQKALAAQKAVQLMQKTYANGELDRAIANDAINREHRAKAALIGILRQNGCNQQQIDDVLQSVDDSRAGDLDSASNQS